jgi:hypothetical protein
MDEMPLPKLYNFNLWLAILLDFESTKYLGCINKVENVF